jgi:hypothetical protein
MPMTESPAPDERPEQSHIDELTAMLLADGEPVPAPAAAHAAACAPCTARVAAFRAEAGRLVAGFALDDGEATFLRRAALPQRVAALADAEGARVRRAPREGVAALAVFVAAALAGSFGWLATAPLVRDGYEIARRLGATALVAQVVSGWAIAGARAAWDVLAVAGRAPLLGEPAIPLLALALLTWLALAIVLPPRPGTPAGAGRTGTA